MWSGLSQTLSEISRAGSIAALDKTKVLLDQLKIQNHPFAILDIILVALVVYWFWSIIAGTRAARILYGIFILLILMVLGSIFHLSALNWLLKYLLLLLVVAIPIVIQPELRAALERLGRTKFVGDFSLFTLEKIEHIATEIVDAVEVLSSGKMGALIVIKRKYGLREYIEKGVEMGSKIQKELLVSIFSPKSPLHDGAVIISGNLISSASVILPIDHEIDFDQAYGARHRAAISVSANTDALVIVISEESSQISLAVAGKLYRDLTPQRLKVILLEQLSKKYRKIKRKKIKMQERLGKK